MVIVVLIVVGVLGAVIWILNSPGARVARAIDAAAPGVVVQWNSFTGTNGDSITIVLANTVTREVAVDLECRVVLPLLVRERSAAHIVIRRADDEYQLNGDECPSANAA